VNVAATAQICPWRVLIDRLTTWENIARKGVSLGSNTCPLCNKQEDKIKHLFINCEVATKVWDKWI